MGVVHGGGWFIRSSHVALIYSPKPRIYFIHYAFPGADLGGWLHITILNQTPGGLLLLSSGFLLLALAVL